MGDSQILDAEEAERDVCQDLILRLASPAALRVKVLDLTTQLALVTAERDAALAELARRDEEEG